MMATRISGSTAASVPATTSAARMDSDLYGQATTGVEPELVTPLERRRRHSLCGAEEVPQNLSAFLSHPLIIDSCQNADTQKSALALLHEYQQLPSINNTTDEDDNERSRDDEPKTTAPVSYAGLLDTDVDAFLQNDEQPQDLSLKAIHDSPELFVSHEEEALEVEMNDGISPEPFMSQTADVLPISMVDMQADCGDNMTRDTVPENESSSVASHNTPTDDQPPLLHAHSDSISISVSIASQQPPVLQPVMNFNRTATVSSAPIREAEVLLTARTETVTRPSHLLLDSFHGNYETPKRRSSKKASAASVSGAPPGVTGEQRLPSNAPATPPVRTTLTSSWPPVKREPDEHSIGLMMSESTPQFESSGKLSLLTPTAGDISGVDNPPSNDQSADNNSNSSCSYHLTAPSNAKQRKTNNHSNKKSYDNTTLHNNNNNNNNNTSNGVGSVEMNGVGLNAVATPSYALPASMNPMVAAAAANPYTLFDPNYAASSNYPSSSFVYAIDSGGKQVAMPLPPVSAFIATQQMSNPMAFFSSPTCGPGTYYHHPSFQFPYNFVYQPSFAAVPAAAAAAGYAAATGIPAGISLAAAPTLYPVDCDMALQYAAKPSLTGEHSLGSALHHGNDGNIVHLSNGNVIVTGDVSNNSNNNNNINNSAQSSVRYGDDTVSSAAVAVITRNTDILQDNNTSSAAIGRALPPISNFCTGDLPAINQPTTARSHSEPLHAQHSSITWSGVTHPQPHHSVAAGVDGYVAADLAAVYMKRAGDAASMDGGEGGGVKQLYSPDLMTPDSSGDVDMATMDLQQHKHLTSSQDINGNDPASPVDQNASARKALKRKSSVSPSVGSTCDDRTSNQLSSYVPKLTDDVTGYQYYIDAPTSASQRVFEDRLTYLNKGQFYSLNVEWTNKGRLPSSDVVKSIVLVVFREGKAEEEELKFWQLWHSRQHSIKQHILDIDVKNSVGVLPNSIHELAYNAVEFRWKPLEQAAKINIMVSCLSTDFSNQKGVKGVALHVQVDTFENEDVVPVHRGYCQIKVFCDKGAERKARDEERRRESKIRSNQANSRSTCPSEDIYHRPADRSYFYPSADLHKKPVLFLPYLPFMPARDSYSLPPPLSPAVEMPPSLPVAHRMPVAAAQPPVVTATTPVQNHVMQDNRTNEPAPKASPLQLYVRDTCEEAFRALILDSPTVGAFIAALQSKYASVLSKVKNVFKRSKKGFLVQLDDDVVRRYTSESAFVMHIQQAHEADPGTVDVTLTEVED